MTMPYSQNRVKYIKKKFESSFSDENKTLSSKPGLFKTQVLEEFKDANIDKVMLKKKGTTAFEMTDGKSPVKRTPAFRRERIEFTNPSQKKIIPGKRYESSRACNIEQKNTEYKTSGNLAILVNNDLTNLQKSNIETNTKLYEESSKTNNHLFTNEPHLLDVSKNDNKNEINGKVLIQAEVNKRDLGMINTEGQKGIGLKCSESIRRALESPLPKGPPPKKPPRTFCHTSQNTCVQSRKLNSDIPVLKSKLEKLEKVIKTHELGIQNANSKQYSKCDLHQKSGKNVVEEKLLLEVPNKKIESQSSCLQLSNCLNQWVNEKLIKEKSEYYLYKKTSKSELDHVLCEMNKTIINECKVKDTLFKANSIEPVYDVPCVNKKNDFKTFGKLTEENKIDLKQQRVEGLHYMCTDVVNHTCKSLHPTTSDRRKSLDDERWTETFNLKSKFSNDALRRISSSMSNIENDEKQIIDLVKNLKIKENNKNEYLENKNEALKSTAFYYSSTESDSDSSSTHSSTNEVSFPPKFSRERELERLKCQKLTKNVKMETLSDVTAKRKVYVREVSSTLFNENSSDISTNGSAGSAYLFESCLLVGLTLCESKKNVPYIKSIFPPDAKPPPLIESLCFPDASYWPPNSENQQPEEQCYSLVITNQNGCRKFGYCRRVLPEGGHYCLPLTYCIISPHRANGFYYKVLRELESRHGSPEIEDFIQRLYKCQFPGPGGRLKLMEILEKATQITPSKKDEYLSTTLVRRPCDIRLEEKDLAHLVDYLQLPVLLKVFSSLLHERKILLLSNSLRKLSTCSEALHSILLPFSWKHTYIPVLPVHLIEMCDAPTPYVIGLLKHKNVEQLIANINFEDGILVDLDNSKVLKCCGDEGSILPPKLVKDLKTSLNLVVVSTNLSDTNRNVLISDAFIRFFVQVCGNYSKFISNLSNGNKNFEKEEFIKSFSSNTTQAFLEWFTETSMFSTFIQERLHGSVEDIPVKLFRLRAMEYSEGAMKNSTVLRKNCKVINRKVRTLGDKIKDLTSFTK